jgi:hypothetical protein
MSSVNLTKFFEYFALAKAYYILAVKDLVEEKNLNVIMDDLKVYIENLKKIRDEDKEKKIITDEIDSETARLIGGINEARTLYNRDLMKLYLLDLGKVNSKILENLVNYARGY